MICRLPILLASLLRCLLCCTTDYMAAPSTPPACTPEGYCGIAGNGVSKQRGALLPRLLVL